MSQTLDIVQWIQDLKRASHQMILEDNILEKAPELFKECENMTTKSDGIHCDSDEGAFTIMTELFCNILIHQFEQVELLFTEYFPLMSPNWKLHKEVWMFRLMMYQKFQMSDGKIRKLCNELEARITTGKIQSVQSGIWKHWLTKD